MRIESLEAAEPFITKDGSEIRELAGLPTGNSVNQSLAQATVPPGAATEAHFHRVTEEIYFFTGGAGRMILGEQESRGARGRLRRHPARPAAPADQRDGRAARAALLLLAALHARGHRAGLDIGARLRALERLDRRALDHGPSGAKREPWHGQSHERSAR